MANLAELADQQLTAARAEEHGRSAEIVVRDGPLRQTVLALTNGTRLAEHNSPPAASLQVLRGKVAVTFGGREETVDEGELRVLTHERHAVLALADSAFLLTTVTSVEEHSHGR